MLRKSIFLTNARIKDCLLTITNKCAECNIATFCENQQSFVELLENLSPQAIELIEESFLQNAFTKRIMNTYWHDSLEAVTIR